MTDGLYSKPTNYIFDFKPKSQLDAEAKLKAFIQWAKETLPQGIPNRVHASIAWEDLSWHRHGVIGCVFTTLGSTKAAQKEMQLPFTDFAKALVVYRCIYLQKKRALDWLNALKALEVALVELTGTRDVMRVSAAVCNRACENMKNHWRAGESAYNFGRSLGSIITLMRDKDLLKTNFQWTSPLTQNSRGTLKQQRANRELKLPNPEAIKALGELFNNDLTNELDIVVTSACALLLSAPSRVGELADVEHDCVVFKEDTKGNRRMFLRWYAEKKNKTLLKPVIKPEMEPVVERAIRLMKQLTDEAREYAAWLEDNPDQFPDHEGLPEKGADDPLTWAEACAALKLEVHKNHRPRGVFCSVFLKAIERQEALNPSARALLAEIREGLDASGGKKVFANGKPGIRAIEFDDRCVITLRKLNVLVREKYLPKDFPYTTPYQDGKARVKFRDALFTVRTGTLTNKSDSSVVKKKDFGVEIAAKPARLSTQLAGNVTRRDRNIFLRHGYTDLTVNTHAFRHELNTRMHQAGLSQLLIDAFSGRTAMGSVYNHETIEERTQAVAAYHPKTKHGNAAQRLEKIKTNQPLSYSDVKDLEGSEQDRILHQSHVGICIHNFGDDLCPKMGACLTCGKLGCVKGDDVKLANLKEERTDLKRRYDRALDAQSRDIFGASERVKKVGMDLYKCDALIRALENPELEKGDIVWNIDNGWTLAKNAAVMSGLIDAKAVEANNEKQKLPSLDDLSAMLDGIEV